VHTHHWDLKEEERVEGRRERREGKRWVKRGKKGVSLING
jgi:hypothetical protein